MSAHDRSPSPELQEVLEQIGTLEKKSEGSKLRMAWMTRALKAIAVVAQNLSEEELGRAVSASTNAQAIVTGLLQPSSGALIEPRPLDAARLRGIKAREALLLEEGGTIRGEDVAKVLRMSRQAVSDRRASGRLLAVEVGKRGYLYPVWQFLDDGVLPGLESVLGALAYHPPLAVVRFFLTGSHRLSGKRPLDRLRRGDIDAVLRDARAFGEHGAA